MNHNRHEQEAQEVNQRVNLTLQSKNLCCVSRFTEASGFG